MTSQAPSFRSINWLISISMFIFALMLSSRNASAQDWSQLSLAGTPPSTRYRPSAVYDAPTRQLIVFAGGALGSNNNQVWALKLGGSPQWTQMDPAGSLPEPRVGSSTAYDTGNSRMIMFGGGLGNTSPCANDVWVLSNANSVNGTPTWTQLTPTGSAPSGRWVSSAVYDPNSNRMTIFGGNNCFSGFSNDVWVLSNANGLGGASAWTQLSPSGTPPGPKGYHTAVYDPGSNRMILFGLASGGTISNQVWVLTNANGLGGTPTWIQLAPAGPAIPARNNQSAVYDAHSNRMMIFAGGSTVDLNDAWVLANANGLGGTPEWTQLTPTGALPPVREGHVAGFDSLANQVVIFGGSTAPLTYFNDVWVLTNANGLTNANTQLLVSDLGDSSIKRYDGTTGAFVDSFVVPHSGGLQSPTFFITGPDGNLYVTDCGAGFRGVKRYSGLTGSYIDDFLSAGSGSCYGLAFGPDGNFYAVAGPYSTQPSSIRRYNGSTGALIGDFVPGGTGGLGYPQGFVFGPDGNLYVADANGTSGDSAIRRYNGLSGAFIDDFVPSAGADPTSVRFGPDGNLYVDQFYGGMVHRYNGVTGDDMGVFVPGLYFPADIAFGPDGNLYSNLRYSSEVNRFDGGTGASLGTFASSGIVGETFGLLWFPTPNLVTPPDTTPPVILPNIIGSLSANEWYVTDVTVSWNVSDPESGIATSTGCGPTTLFTNTMGTQLTCSATNGAGLTSSVTVTAKIDKTPPVITPNISGTLGNNGWYVSDVTVNWSATDADSGVVSSTGCDTILLSADTGGAHFTCTATNGAGLSSSVPLTIKIDKTPPAISGLPAAGCALWPPNHKLNLVADVTAADGLSGLAPGTFNVTATSNEPTAPKGPQIVIGPDGSGGYNVQLQADRLGSGNGRTYMMTATATDLAGNTTTATATCIVPHDQGH